MAIIKQGDHYSGFFSISGTHYKRSSMKRMVSFDDNCLALPNRIDCDKDINKLFGWSYGNIHNNSIRVGWRSSGTAIEVFAYIYENGRRRSRKIATVPTDDLASIEVTHNHYTNSLVFIVNDVSWASMWAGSSPSMGYTCEPYYGGDCTAPKTMEMLMV
jgi:hypothetical protein